MGRVCSNDYVCDALMMCVMRMRAELCVCADVTDGHGTNGVCGVCDV